MIAWVASSHALIVAVRIVCPLLIALSDVIFPIHDGLMSEELILVMVLIVIAFNGECDTLTVSLVNVTSTITPYCRGASVVESIQNEVVMLGPDVGSALGAIVGGNVGAMVGFDVGVLVGYEVGSNVRCCLGPKCMNMYRLARF